MDNTARAIAKAATWQGLGLFAMSLIGYVFTGSFGAGGSIAVTAAAISFVAYIVHERIWSSVRWGREPAGRGEG